MGLAGNKPAGLESSQLLVISRVFCASVGAIGRGGHPTREGRRYVEIVTQAGLAFLARWAHILAGITWIGILYYFNFVQVPAFAEMEPGARSEALRKITWRALWWFRWGAVLTVLSGLTILAFNKQFNGDGESSFGSPQAKVNPNTGLAFTSNTALIPTLSPGADYFGGARQAQLGVRFVF